VDREGLAELFSAFGSVGIRRMFSGFGLYADEVCFSLFLRGELYFKADETSVPRFAAEGSRPFSYTQTKSGKVVTVNSFWRLPERLYDDPDELAAWTRAAVASAQRQKLGKRVAMKKPAPKRPKAGKRKAMKTKPAKNKNR
jgi:DNA transformation protein and related proteins